jgi:hypothetical protein
LHHHFDRSLYAETFFANAIQNKLWINTQTYTLSKNPEKTDKNWGVWLQLFNLNSQDSLFFSKTSFYKNGHPRISAY